MVNSVGGKMSDKEQLDAHCFCCDVDLVNAEEIRFGICSECLENSETIKDVFESGEMYLAMTFNIFQAIKHRIQTLTEPEDYN